MDTIDTDSCSSSSSIIDNVVLLDDNDNEIHYNYNYCEECGMKNHLSLFYDGRYICGMCESNIIDEMYAMNDDDYDACHEYVYGEDDYDECMVCGRDLSKYDEYGYMYGTGKIVCNIDEHVRRPPPLI